MVVPVWKGDAVAYTLAVALAPDAIFASARRSMPDGWIAAIIDRDGNIAARSRDGERYVGQRATPSLLAAIDGRSEGTSETMTKDDGAMLTAFSRSTRGDWTVAVGVPKTLLVASLHRSIAWLAVAALAVLGGVLWFAYRISHAVTQRSTTWSSRRWRSATDDRSTCGRRRSARSTRSAVRSARRRAG